MNRRYNGGESAGLPFLKLLAYTTIAGLSATDPRDHIYGLLGLFSKDEKIGIIMDYKPSSSMEKLLWDTAKTRLLRYGTKVLRYCLPSPLRNKLPSWVPDWTSDDEFSIGVASPEGSFFDASKGLHCDAIYLSSVAYENPILHLEGVTIGMVQHRGSNFEGSWLPVYRVDDCRQWLLEVAGLISSAQILEVRTQEC